MNSQTRLSDRRSFLRMSLASAISAAEVVTVPWSSGVQPPKVPLPPNATDCHHHIYDSRFPADPKATLRPANATVQDYRLLQKRLGATRNVIVQPSTYGVDNRCLLAALDQFGLSATRGIAVVNTGVSDSELRSLNAAGVCGIRFNLVQIGATTLDMVEPLAKRVASLDWHIQMNALPAQIAGAAALWNRLPCPVVFDHLGHVSQAGAGDAAFGVIARLLQKGTGWVKLSGFYMDSRIGPPAYADRGLIVKAYTREAPERLVWGTDWPHPTIQAKPDDAMLADLLAQWTADEGTRAAILVTNPAKLYRF